LFFFIILISLKIVSILVFFFSMVKGDNNQKKPKKKKKTPSLLSSRRSKTVTRMVIDNVGQRSVITSERRITRSSGKFHTVRGWLNYFEGMENVLDSSLDGFRDYDDHNADLLSFADFVHGLCRCSAGGSMCKAITNPDRRKEFTDGKQKLFPDLNS